MEPFVCKSPTQRSGGLRSPRWPWTRGCAIETGCSSSAGSDVIAEGGGGAMGWTLAVFKAG